MLSLLRSKTAKSVTSNTIYQLIGKTVTTLVTVSITLLITRNYGKSGYGEFNIMQSFPALFFIIADFGMNAIATRELSLDWKKAQKYISNVLSLRVLISLLLIFVASIIVLFFPYSKALIIGTQFGLFLILTQSMFATTNIVFQVKQRYDLSTIGLMCGYGLLVIVALLASYFKLPVAWINFSYVIGGLLTFLVNFSFLRKLGVSPKIEFDSKVIKFLLLESLPLGIMFIFSQVNFRADTLLLSALKLPVHMNLSNTESVGIYGLAYKIFEVLLVLPTFFMNAIYPTYVRKMGEGKEQLRLIFFSSLRLLFVGGLTIGILGYIFAPLAIRLLGGKDFGLSVLPLQILMGGLFVFYLTQPISWLIVTLGNQRYLPAIYLLSALVNVSSNFLLIPKYSFVASACITILSESIILLLLSYFARKSWNEKYAS